MEAGRSTGSVIALRRRQLGLSQQQLAAKLCDLSGRSTVTRHEVSRWERDERIPTSEWLRWLSNALDIDIAFLERTTVVARPRRLWSAIAPSPAGSRSEHDLDALEFARRVSASDVGGQTLARIEEKVDELAIAYPSTPSTDLLAAVRLHQGYIVRLIDGRKTLAEHRRLLTAASWLSLLGATIYIDLKQRRTAMAWLRTAADLANEVGDQEILGWCLETRAWDAVNEGQYRLAGELARAAQQMAPRGGSAFIQATAQEGRTWARLGEHRQTREALDRLARLVSSLSMPERPEHHFRYDPAKAVAYTATTLAWIGDPAAEEYARAAVDRLESPAKGGPRPRRAAAARLDLALALLAAGKPDEASATVMTAILSGRLVPSNYWRIREVVSAVEARGLARARELREAFDTLITTGS